MADDDIDLYNDLDDFQVEEEKKEKELQEAENKHNELTKIIEDLRAQIKTKDKEIKKMHTNFQILLDTAMAETKRKDQVINDLRRQVDDICFRRRKPGHHPRNEEFVESQIEQHPMTHRANPFKEQHNIPPNPTEDTCVLETNTNELTTNMEIDRQQMTEDNERSRGDKYFNMNRNNQKAHEFRDRSRGHSSGRTLSTNPRRTAGYQEEDKHEWHQRDEKPINDNSTKRHQQEDHSRQKSRDRQRHDGERKERAHSSDRSGNRSKSKDRWHSGDHAMKRSKSRDRTHYSSKSGKNSQHSRRSKSRDRHRQDRHRGKSTDRANKDDAAKPMKHHKESKSHTEEQQTTNQQRDDSKSNETVEEIASKEAVVHPVEERAEVQPVSAPTDPRLPWLAKRQRRNSDIELIVLHYDTTTTTHVPAQQQQHHENAIEEIATRPMGNEEYDREARAEKNNVSNTLLTPTKLQIYNNLIAQPKLLSNVMQLIGRQSPTAVGDNHFNMDKMEGHVEENTIEGKAAVETNGEIDGGGTTLESTAIIDDSKAVEGRKTENEVAGGVEKMLYEECGGNRKPTEEIVTNTEEEEDQKESPKAHSEAVLERTKNVVSECSADEQKEQEQQMEQMKESLEEPSVEDPPMELKADSSEETPLDANHETPAIFNVEKDMENTQKEPEESPTTNDKLVAENSKQNHADDENADENIFKSPPEQPEDTNDTVRAKRRISGDDDNDTVNDIRRTNKKKRHFMNVIKDDSDDDCDMKPFEEFKKLREMPKAEEVGPSQLSTPRREEKFNEIDRKLNEMFTSPVPLCGETKLRATTMMTLEFPTSSQETIASFGEGSRHEDVPTTDVTIDETVDNTTASNGTLAESLNTSGEVKHISLGSKDYRFEKVDENVVKLVITRKRGKKRKT